MKKVFLPVALLLVLLANIMFLHSMIVGILAFVLYTLFTGLVWADIIESVFSVRNRFLHILLGLGFVFIMLGLLASVFVVFYKITPLSLALIFVLFALGTFFLRKKVRLFHQEEVQTKEILFGIFPQRKFVFFCFFILSLLQILILYLCRTERVLESPWQVIHPWYLYNFFFLTGLLVFILFSRVSFRIKFSLILVYSILLHLYLPLIHSNPWGGDVWRLMGVEGKLASGAPELPTLPQALINPYKYTYGQLWGLLTVLHKTLGLSLLVLQQWFMAIFWALLLPTLSLSLGIILFKEEKKALLLAALSSFPFALQAIGSITVSVSLGFLTFLFALFFWLSFLQEKKIWQKNIALGFGVCMIFGYALFALLFWFLVGVSYIVEKFWGGNMREKRWKEYSQKQKLICISLCLFAVLFIPLVDLLFGFSHFPQSFSVLQFVKQVFGQFGAWYFVRPIQGTEIASANIFFNHMHTSSFVKNIFTSFRFPVLLSMFLALLASLRALWIFIQKEKNTLWHVLGILFFSLFGGYIIGWYILQGERVFVRRLDSVLAWLFLVWILYGIFSLLKTKIFETWSTKKRMLGFFVALTLYSFVATTLYASGPDIRVMSQDEYRSAQFIFSEEKENSTPCVLADTWILLGLEASSAGKIVGGGFPIGANFSQAQRVALFAELLKNPDSRIFSKIQSVLPVSSCLVALSRDTIDPTTEQNLSDFLGSPIFRSGPVLVWRMELKSSEN